MQWSVVLRRSSFAAAVAIAAAAMPALVGQTASAQGTPPLRLEILSRDLAGNGQLYGRAGQIEVIRGRVHGEVDPADRRNRIVQDIDLAPRNARGRVEYVATFALAKPVDRARASGTVTIPRADWVFADCRTVPFPGTLDPARLCLRHGFAPDRLYELVYTARDPLVLGIGLVATRDLVSFLRYGKEDAAGHPNPVAGVVRHTISVGNSQSGNFIKTFIHLGFNEDLSGRPVWDGAFPRIAARQTPMNFRFALPGGAVDLYEPGSEGVMWWSPYRDTTRSRGEPASLFDRCSATRTCPKVIEAFGSAEFWGLRMSPGLVGTDAAADIPLPDNVRRYYFPGTTHGGGRGGFALPASGRGGRGGGVGACALPANPNPMNEHIRALTTVLVEWVSAGTPPPTSRYPTLAGGELVPATAAAMGFPRIPGAPPIEGLVKHVLDYDFGPEYRANDLTGIITRLPPSIVQVLPTRVPRVDADGNETSGVPSPLHQAPLGTYLGWNVARGFFDGQICGFQGGWIPFAATRTQREKTGDPRPSIEERYGTLEGYACTVERAADQLVRERFLLPDDRDRLLAEVRASTVLPPAAESTPGNRARGEAVCAAR